MTKDIRHTNSELSATRELRATIQGRVLLRGEDDYARTRRIWNGAVEMQPALFVVCETSTDVQVAVSVARRHGHHSRCGAAGTTGQAVPCAVMDSSLTSPGCGR
jgi:FAD/FMN-containing dehydrogenase